MTRSGPIMQPPATVHRLNRLLNGRLAWEAALYDRAAGEAFHGEIGREATAT